MMNDPGAPNNCTYNLIKNYERFKNFFITHKLDTIGNLLLQKCIMLIFKLEHASHVLMH